MSKFMPMTGFPMLNLRSAIRGAGTELADIIVPEIFAPYVQNRTSEKSRLIQSGALAVSDRLNACLAGEGTTFNQRFFNDLDSTTETEDGLNENVSRAHDDTDSKPDNIKSSQEIQIRCARNKSWGSADLLDSLISPDPMQAITELVSGYRVRRLQRQFISVVRGMFAMNALDPVNGSTHTKNDMVKDVSGDAFQNEVTNFGPAAFIQACGTMGDSLNDLSLVMMHSVVYQRLQLLNLIDFIPDARGEVNIAYYQGKEVIVDDAMPHTADGIFETWIMGRGVFKYGIGSSKHPVEVQRRPASYNGAGSEILYNRWENIIHPTGHAWIGTTMTEGGPTNLQLQTAANWRRVFPERKQIKIARLITREF